LTTIDPRTLATTYLTSWQRQDFDTLRGTLADDVTFRGVLGATDGIDDALAGLRGMAAIVMEFRVQAMVADGDDVMTWYDFHSSVAEPMPTVNWSHVRDGKIAAIRAVFDPRPLLAATAR
jgi:limonene-1,2-epoxide hydrolase